MFSVLKERRAKIGVCRLQYLVPTCLLNNSMMFQALLRMDKRIGTQDRLKKVAEVMQEVGFPVYQFDNWPRFRKEKTYASNLRCSPGAK